MLACASRHARLHSHKHPSSPLPITPPPPTPPHTLPPTTHLQPTRRACSLRAGVCLPVGLQRGLAQRAGGRLRAAAPCCARCTTVHAALSGACLGVSVGEFAQWSKPDLATSEWPPHAGRDLRGGRAAPCMLGRPAAAVPRAPSQEAPPLPRAPQIVRRPLHYALVDEVDSILIGVCPPLHMHCAVLHAHRAPPNPTRPPDPPPPPPAPTHSPRTHTHAHTPLPPEDPSSPCLLVAKNHQKPCPPHSLRFGRPGLFEP